VTQLGRTGGGRPERAVRHPAERHDHRECDPAHRDRDGKAEQEAPEEREALPGCPAARVREQPPEEVADRLAGPVVHEEQRDHLGR
jgi:hypothetical protein